MQLASWQPEIHWPVQSGPGKVTQTMIHIIYLNCKLNRSCITKFFQFLDVIIMDLQVLSLCPLSPFSQHMAVLAYFTDPEKKTTSDGTTVHVIVNDEDGNSK